MVSPFARFDNLSDSDCGFLDRLIDCLRLLADLARSDVLLYVGSPDGDSAEIVSEAKPQTVPPIYQRSMCGQVVTRRDEPAVFRVLAGMRPVRRLNRALKHGVPTLQDVWPVEVGGRIIAALSIETGILEIERQERRSLVYRRAVDQVRRMMLRGQLEGCNNISHLSEHDGPMIVDNRGTILYVSSVAENLYRKLGYTQSLLRRNLTNLQTDESVFFKAVESGGCVEQLVQEGNLIWIKRAIPLVAQARAGWLQMIRRDAEELDGVIVFIQDITGEQRREQELKIKSALIQEIHHRVKNNLQTIAALLRLQARRTTSPEIGDVLRQTTNRILSIAVVHEYLSHEEENVINVRDMCQRIITEVTQGILDPEKTIRFALDGPDLHLPAQQATSCALIINELLQNSVKHAFSQKNEGRVEVHLRDDGDQLAIEIADDGQGLSPEYAKRAEKSLGLQIVSTLVREDLKGHFEISRPEGESGTRAVVTFPKVHRQAVDASNQ
jgi:two-component system, sensor histidine kinase PdtaS